MSKNSDAVKRWRRSTKSRMVAAMGGACQIESCGYNRCNEALSFHHLDPLQKDFSFGAMRANPRSWTVVAAELRKCILLCHNCHTEVHLGLIKLPDNFKRFDESFAVYDGYMSGSGRKPVKTQEERNDFLADKIRKKQRKTRQRLNVLVHAEGIEPSVGH